MCLVCLVIVCFTDNTQHDLGGENLSNPMPDANRFTTSTASQGYCCSHFQLLEMCQRIGNPLSLGFGGRQADSYASHSKPGLSLSRFETSASGRGLGEEPRNLPHGHWVPSRHWVVRQQGDTWCDPQIDTASRLQSLGLHGEDSDLRLEMGCCHYDHEDLGRKTGDYCDLQHGHHAHGKLDEQVGRVRCRAAQCLERRWAGMGLCRRGPAPDAKTPDWRDDVVAIREDER